ncbi:hypothetical protein VB779_06370 [Haloarculaceae archaeon H-GB11]|nr:hypothetical protein [Haloarculaceae archaeon H-GB11]
MFHAVGLLRIDVDESSRFGTARCFDASGKESVMGVVGRGLDDVRDAGVQRLRYVARSLREQDDGE